MKTVAILCLISAILFAIFKFSHDSLFPQSDNQTAQTQAALKGQLESNKVGDMPSQQGQQIGSSTLNQTEQKQLEELMAKISDALEAQNFRLAIDLVNKNYDEIDSDQFDVLEQRLFFSMQKLVNSSDYKNAISLVRAYSEHFGHPEMDYLSALSYRGLGDYRSSIQYLIQALNNEYRETALSRAKATLLQVSNEYKLELTKNNQTSKLAVLFESLYNQFPNEPLFILEYAIVLTSAGEYQTAKSLLENLIYEPEYNSQARQLLDKIAAVLTPAEKAPVDNTPTGIPLIKLGNSYLARVRINGRNTTLLLDTGASITAISERTARSLGLIPTGRNIVLNTANGQTRATLYQADSISLGRYKVNNMVVAGITIQANSQFKGLLGTDWLNQFNYRINSSNNSLTLNKR